jgi:hypothetical protein
MWFCNFLFSEGRQSSREEVGRNTTEGPLLNQPIAGEAPEHAAMRMSTLMVLDASQATVNDPSGSQAQVNDPTQVTPERHQLPVRSRSISLSPDSPETSMPMPTFNVPKQASANDPSESQAAEDVPTAGTPESWYTTPGTPLLVHQPPRDVPRQASANDPSESQAAEDVPTADTPESWYTTPGTPLLPKSSDPK